MLEESLLPDTNMAFSLANPVRLVKCQVSGNIALPLREHRVQPSSIC